MTMPVQATVEPDEAPVEEVRCAETGVPISSIPSWYANVNVKFISQQAAKKHGTLNPALAEDAARTPTLDAEEAEPAIEEVELEEIELEDEAAEDEE